MRCSTRCSARGAIKATVNGFLLIEVLTACTILGLCLSILIPVQQWLVRTQSHQQDVLNKAQKRRILESQFEAQWQSIGKFGCSGVPRSIVIGNEFNAPLSNRAFASGSDWLKGLRLGECVAEYHQAGNHLVGQFSGCSINQINTFQLDQCSRSFSVNTSLNHDGRFNITLPSELIETSGLIASSEPTLWYVALGQAGRNGLWKKSELERAAQEIESGVEHIAFYPLLDTDGDGNADAISTEYGAVMSSQVIGIWVEYVYRFTHCSTLVTAPTSHVGSGSSTVVHYTNFRAKRWSYDPSCESVAGYLLELGVK
ncbi:type II secretion system protein [Marinomonas mediterranea]|uniref:type II secretion system protein n=1 Tax=Marinomonas mediterranea TaxID=119864 RepID=UPI00234BFE77|nr:hypothetical protein [Marinomonas mediterranea]WCN10245.1 hypothetical protein GV055_15670 [Marinomonas mediterranea]